MQSLGCQSLSSPRSAAEGSSSAENPAKAGASERWWTRAEVHAERAARVGFVLSMIFFGAAATYGIALSSVAGPYFQRAVRLADRAAFEAGFRIETLSMSGRENAPSKLLLETLRLPYAGSILSYDTAEARDRLLKLGWVDRAEVRRILPSRLEISIAERAPFARWASAGKVYVIDREGRTLGEDESENFGRLLLVEGDGAPAEAAALSDALAGRDELRAKIERAELVAERFWAVKLTGGPIAKLPRKVNALSLDRLEALLANSKVNGMDLEAIDLRLPHRTILQLQEPTIANRDKAIASLSSPQALAAPPRKAKPL